MRPVNQTLLTVIIGLMMLSAFIGVYAVSYQYNTTSTIETVFVSDSNMQFSQIDNTASSDPSAVAFGVQTIESVKYYYDPFPTVGTVVKNNCTPAYIGNNTWAASMIGFAIETPLYSGALHYIPIDVPNAKTFIAENITINMTMPNELIAFTFAIGGYNTPNNNPTSGVLLSNLVPITSTHYDAKYILTDYQKLAWYNSAKNNDMPSMAIYLYDPSAVRDGLSSFALELKIEITGVQITTWSLQDTINVVLGAAIIGNAVTIIYMTDTIDFNATRKDLNSKTNSGRQKKRR